MKVLVVDDSTTMRRIVINTLLRMATANALKPAMGAKRVIGSMRPSAAF